MDIWASIRVEPYRVKAKPAHLVLIKRGGQKVGPLPHKLQYRMDLGRGKGRTVKVDDNQISRLHTTVIYEEDAWIIFDRGSANGTFVNEERLPCNGCVPLNHGDIVGLGPFTKLRFEIERVVEANQER